MMIRFCLAAAFLTVGLALDLQVQNVLEVMWYQITNNGAQTSVTAASLGDYIRRYQNQARTQLEVYENEFNTRTSNDISSFPTDMSAVIPPMTTYNSSAYFRMFDVDQGLDHTVLTGYLQLTSSDMTILIDLGDENPFDYQLSKAEWDKYLFHNEFRAIPFMAMFLDYKGTDAYGREAVFQSIFMNIFNDVDNFGNGDGLIVLDEMSNWWYNQGYGSPAWGENFFYAMDEFDDTRIGYGQFLTSALWSSAYNALEIDGYAGLNQNEFAFGLHCVTHGFIRYHPTLGMDIMVPEAYDWDWCT